MADIKVTLPDGTVLEVPEGSTVADVAAAIGPGLAKAALAGEVDDQTVDLFHTLEADAGVRIITDRDEYCPFEPIRGYACVLSGKMEPYFFEFPRGQVGARLEIFARNEAGNETSVFSTPLGRTPQFCIAPVPDPLPPSSFGVSAAHRTAERFFFASRSRSAIMRA